VLISAHALFCLATATTCTSPSKLPTLFSAVSVNGLLTQVLVCSYYWTTSHSFFCFQQQWTHILQSQFLLHTTTAPLLAHSVTTIPVLSVAQVVHHYYLTVILVIQNLIPVKSLHGTERSALLSLSNQVKWGKWICFSTTFHQVELGCLLLSSSGVWYLSANITFYLMSLLATRIWVRMIELFEMSHWWSQQIRVALLITDSFASASHSQQRPAC